MHCGLTVRSSVTSGLQKLGSSAHPHHVACGQWGRPSAASALPAQLQAGFRWESTNQLEDARQETMRRSLRQHTCEYGEPNGPEAVPSEEGAMAK